VKQGRHATQNWIAIITDGGGLERSETTCGGPIGVENWFIKVLCLEI